LFPFSAAALIDVGALSTPGVAQGVAVAGGLAYVSNPAAPVELGVVDSSNYWIGLAVQDGFAYITDFSSGLRVVEVEIKPGSDPNSINPSLEGGFPVAILGSGSFDVADVEVTTLAFGPSGASFDHSHGPHFEDVNGNGVTDLMAHFQAADTDDDGFDDGEEVLALGTDPLDPLDPEPTPVPEPTARLMTLAGAALLGWLAHRRSRRRYRGF
jgi:hypothetical protein